ncbi:MAG: TonB-dependent receptor [Saprospiraceae bacterium]|nr:TonB-dependent receptor [Candidatus Opimibacter iunctus]
MMAYRVTWRNNIPVDHRNIHFHLFQAGMNKRNDLNISFHGGPQYWQHQFLSLLAILFFISCTPMLLQAQDQQEITITGTITDTEGNTLPGAGITATGTAIGTISNETGAYSITLPATTVSLEYSYLGFVRQVVDINGQRIINIVLQPDANALSEVVVVGYGVEQRKLLTGSIGIVDGDALKDLPVSTIDGLIQGQTTGVQVSQNSGTPGGEMSVRIRGVSSIGGSSQPLYVIDGIPVTTGDFAQVGYEGQGVNALTDLSPADIESISVLKDASAASIYGARASNGVILITTKRGSGSKAVSRFSASYGVQETWRRLDMLNAHDWKVYRNDLANAEVFSPEEIADNTIDVNWQDVIFRTAPMQQYELSTLGGNDKTTFFISGNFFTQEGIVIGTDYNRLNGRVNVDHHLSKNLTIGTSIGLSYAKTNRVEGDQTLHGPLPNGISTPAIFPVYNEDGSYNQDGPYSNAVSIANEAINENYSYRALANVYADYTILPGLSFNTKWGIDFLDFREHAYESIKTVQGAKYNGLGFETYSNVSNLVSNNFLKYHRDFNQQMVELQAGYSFEKYQSRSSFIRAQDYADPALEYINSASTIVSASSDAFDQGLRSWIFRGNYTISNTYLFSISGRLDGSSNFSENNRNGFFPAASAGWRISEEGFFNAGSISELKIRASYGLTGNDDIPPFLYAEVYGNTSYADQPGIYPANIPNPDLKWETTSQFDVGLDVGLFEDRVLITADYYNKQTKDLLLDRPLPTSSGFATITENVGRVENQGVELSLTTDNLKNSAFRWQTMLNVSVNRNKVLELYNDQPIDDIGRGSNRIEVGEPIGIFYSYEWLGVDPSTGAVVFADKNFDGKITTADRTKVGNPHPDFIYGFTNIFTYKGFDLNIFFQGSQGNDVFNGSRLFLESLQGGDNQLAVINDRWQQPGDITNIPAATNDPELAASNVRVSSRFIEDGSYLRLKNLTLGYTFHMGEKIKQSISGFRVYFTGQNLFTLTKYSGLDPEVNYLGNDNAVIGTDFFTFPQARIYSFGLNLTF